MLWANDTNVSIKQAFSAPTNSSSGLQTPGSPLNSGGLPTSISGFPGADALPRRALFQTKLLL